MYRIGSFFTPQTNHKRLRSQNQQLTGLLAFIYRSISAAISGTVFLIEALSLLRRKPQTAEKHVSLSRGKFKACSCFWNIRLLPLARLYSKSTADRLVYNRRTGLMLLISGSTPTLALLERTPIQLLVLLEHTDNYLPFHVRAFATTDHVTLAFVSCVLQKHSWLFKAIPAKRSPWRILHLQTLFIISQGEYRCQITYESNQKTIRTSTSSAQFQEALSIKSMPEISSLR